jgi:spore cortex formation protein SpoVR/YcgB (stage V sporulation)
VYKETKGKIWAFLKLYKELIKKRRMSIEQVVNAVEIAIHKLPYMETLYRQAKEEVEKMQRTIQRLANDIEERKNRISLLDRIAFTSEQDGKRTQQQVQELTAKKDRLERLIANILNGEDYSKAKQITIENIKAILSDNKKLISISFVALIQTLKTDPQMIKLIHNIPSADDGEHIDNNDNNNIIKYLEFNKDRLSDLAEKHHENLVEALTDNTIDTDAASNPTLLLPQSSSTFPKPFNQTTTE